MASTNPARGMRDFLPADVRKRNYVIGIIKEVYESYGFEPLETPAVENLETLTGKYGEEGNQLIFKILKRGEKLKESRESGVESRESDLADLALRYDLTVPLARVVANNKNDLPRFFKRYQIQPVWRADRPARGRFREFYQCDVDCIGSASITVEIELISAAITVLDKLGFDDFVVMLNDRRLLFQLLEWANIPVDQQQLVVGAIDKLDKQEPEAVFEEMKQAGIDSAVVERLESNYNNVVATWNAGHEVNEVLLSQYCPGDIDIRKDLLDLTKLVNDSRVIFQPFLARGLSYYTGSIFEVKVRDLSGSLGGGGRYDGLIGMFRKEQIPACGFSLGLERILVVMDERGMFPPEIAGSTPADVLVTIWNEETVADSLKLANDLRSSGLRVMLYPEADKLGKQFKYADSIGVPFVCVRGDAEIEADVVKLKNMKTGEEISAKSSEIASHIK